MFYRAVSKKLGFNSTVATGIVYKKDGREKRHAEISSKTTRRMQLVESEGRKMVET